MIYYTVPILLEICKFLWYEFTKIGKKVSFQMIIIFDQTKYRIFDRTKSNMITRLSIRNVVGKVDRFWKNEFQLILSRIL